MGIVAQAVPATTSGSVCHSPCSATIRSIPRYNAAVTSLMTAPAGSLANRRRLAGVARRHCAITASGTGMGMKYSSSAPIATMPTGRPAPMRNDCGLGRPQPGRTFRRVRRHPRPQQRREDHAGEGAGDVAAANGRKRHRQRLRRRTPGVTGARLDRRRAGSRLARLRRWASPRRQSHVLGTATSSPTIARRRSRRA